MTALILAASSSLDAVAGTTTTLPIANGGSKTFQVPWTQIEPKELLLLVNTADSQSIEVADEYKSLYGIPGSNRLELNFPKEKSLSKSEFQRLYDDVQDFLQTRNDIEAIVVTWTEPWKVSPDGEGAGMSITSAFTFGFKSQYYNSGSEECAVTADSPLYQKDLSEPYTDFGLRPAMMLAGETTQDVRNLLDRSPDAQSSFPLPTGYLMRTTDDARSVRYPQMEDANEYWDPPLSLRIAYTDNSNGDPDDDYIRNKSDVLYYFTGRSKVEYLDTLDFTPGAVADHLTSTGGALTTTQQMSILRWLEAGASGSYGTVSEPCSTPYKFANVDLFLKRYFAGATLIDAYWQSVKQPGEGIFVGDPLVRPYAPKARVNGADQVELTTTGLVEKHLYKIVGVSSDGISTVLITGLNVQEQRLVVVSVPKGFATYKLVDTGDLKSNHGAPKITSASVSKLNLGGGVTRFYVRADDPENHQVYYTFQRADGRLLQHTDDLSVEYVLEGDADGNGYVNFTDLGLVKGAMWTSKGDAGYVPEADFTNDGTIDFEDVGVLKSNFGGTRAALRIKTHGSDQTDLTLIAFDKWGSETQVTARVGNGTLTIL